MLKETVVWHLRKNDMIQHVNAENVTGFFQSFCNIPILTVGIQISAWMIVADNDRRYPFFDWVSKDLYLIVDSNTM